MANETVVTELIIDSRPAEAGSAAYVKAMKMAEAAQAKFVAGENAAATAMEKQAGALTMMSGSISSTAKSWDRLKASVDPAFQATQRMERALLTADAAARKLGIDQVEINRVMDLARAKHLGTAVAVEEGATAARLGSSQMMALSHAARSAAESIALGAPVSQVLTQQLNHLSFAMSGPQGLVAASAGVRAAFGTWLTTLPGMLSAAGVAAVGAVSVFMLATREKIFTVNELLESHKTLLDSIAATYPHLSAELKTYADQAAKLPHSVLAADTQTQVDRDRAALAASLDHLKVDLRELASAEMVVGTAGAAAFGKLADTIDAGNVNVDNLVGSIGDLRLDPALTPDAKKFAENIQLGANETLKLRDILNNDLGIKNVGIDGGHAASTLFDMAGGFKDVGTNAGGADAIVSKFFGTLNSGSDQRFGVSRMGGGFQGIASEFEQANQAMQRARESQLQGMLELDSQLRRVTADAAKWKEAIDTASGADNIKKFFGDVRDIKGADDAISDATHTIDRLFATLSTGSTSVSTVYQGLDMVRQTLIHDGLGVDAVNAFIDSLIKAHMQLDADTGAAATLNRTIQSIRDKTVTITVVTRQVGTGTQSTYDVPNQTGGTSGVGVTRYSSNGPEVSKTPIFNTSTNSWGYTQPKTYQDPYVLALVNAKYPQRAAGGPISANSPYWVGERGPELVVPKSAATVIPNAQSMALANPQSAYTGQVATRETDRMWQLFMNIEANTRKTYEGVEKWGTSSSYSGSGGSSGSGSSASSGAEADPLAAAYSKALATARSNAHNVSGIIGYGAQGLSATPQQIAHRAVYGFASGGIMGQDTQHVEFFKNPNERVIVARPDQFEDQRGGGSSRSGGGSSRSMQVNVNVKVEGGTTISKDSISEMRRQMALAGRDMQRSINGR
ncbi:hypothetical protein NKI46_01080 [Mesorhizobium sp. M0615]|uniref:hypothetical protein n=1 Tax=Mesorhizobium sp. M0615 TaxID=2956971 RepID=UPI0033354715